MRRATGILSQTQMQGRPCVGKVRLDHDHRYRRRLMLRMLDGEPILLDLPNAVHFRGGEGLLLEDGDVVAIEAAAEQLLEITASDAAALIRIAWHLGNRHLPTELRTGTLRIRQDHVVEAMIRGLGGRIAHVEAPFDPEGGAYAGTGHAHGDEAHAHHDHLSHTHSHSAHDEHHGGRRRERE